MWTNRMNLKRRSPILRKKKIRMTEAGYSDTGIVAS
jgi:hypothetical protein